MKRKGRNVTASDSLYFNKVNTDAISRGDKSASTTSSSVTAPYAAPSRGRMGERQGRGGNGGVSAADAAVLRKKCGRF